MREPGATRFAAGGLVILAAAASLLAAVPAASQEELVTRQAIIRQLTAPAEAHRGLVVVEDQAPGEIPGEPAAPSGDSGISSAGPSIEFHSIEFEINSSELTPAARAQLDELGAALSSEELRTFRFEIIGHTDARGSREHNLALSQRRARAVGDFLVQAAGVSPHRLEAIGRGMDAPSRPDDPYAAVNRRVEIRNLGER
jgi:outer membrane protein OmpA-like peptidoglycan-associated protein